MIQLEKRVKGARLVQMYSVSFINFKRKCLFQFNILLKAVAFAKSSLCIIAFVTLKSYINSKKRSYNSHWFYFHRFKTSFCKTEVLWEMVLGHFPSISIIEINDSTSTN